MRRWTTKVIHDRRFAELTAHSGNSTVVLTNGCFDLIHFGHVQLLQTAKLLQESGIILVVAVNSDESVRQLKGPARPIMPQEQRLALVASLEAVDFCFLFDEKRCDRILHQIQPDIWVKGGDYTYDTLDAGERAAADAVGARIEIIPQFISPSTSNLLARINTGVDKLA